MIISCISSWMYWTDTGMDRIERATMDGNRRTTLHSTGLSNAYGLTLDYQSQTLYWVDYSTNRLETSSADGLNRRVLTSSLRDPWSVVFYGGMVYWTDVYFDRIYSFSVSVLQVTNSRLGTDPRGIRVVSEDQQPISMLLAITHFKI